MLLLTSSEANPSVRGSEVVERPSLEYSSRISDALLFAVLWGGILNGWGSRVLPVTLGIVCANAVLGLVD